MSTAKTVFKSKISRDGITKYECLDKNSRQNWRENSAFGVYFMLKNLIYRVLNENRMHFPLKSALFRFHRDDSSDPYYCTRLVTQGIRQQHSVLSRQCRFCENASSILTDLPHSSTENTKKKKKTRQLLGFYENCCCSTKTCYPPGLSIEPLKTHEFNASGLPRSPMNERARNKLHISDSCEPCNAM